MKIFARIMLVFSGMMFFAPIGNSMTLEEMQAEYSNVQATCSSEAGSLSEYARESFIRKCSIEKTSKEFKATSCEHEMQHRISNKAQRDPEMRAKYIDRCIPRWYPGMK